MKILGLTNALTDYVINISEGNIVRFGLKKGGHTSFRKIDFDVVKESSFRKFVGGGPCNTIRGMNALGVDCSLMGVVGDDDVGDFYIGTLKNEGISSYFSRIKEGRSGRCYTFISPDGERSFSVDGGVAFNFDCLKSDVPLCDLFHFSGYELSSDPILVWDFVKELKNSGAKISFDLGYAKGVGRNLGYFEKVIGIADVLFSTEEEREALGDLEGMLGKDTVWVLKKGSRGSVVYRGDEKVDIDSVKVDVMNKNGAGDGYAAGFLVKYLEGKDLEECGNFGSEIAANVCGVEESCFRLGKVLK